MKRIFCFLMLIGLGWFTVGCGSQAGPVVEEGSPEDLEMIEEDIADQQDTIAVEPGEEGAGGEAGAP